MFAAQTKFNKQIIITVLLLGCFRAIFIFKHRKLDFYRYTEEFCGDSMFFNKFTFIELLLGMFQRRGMFNPGGHFVKGSQARLEAAKIIGSDNLLGKNSEIQNLYKPLL